MHVDIFGLEEEGVVDVDAVILEQASKLRALWQLGPVLLATQGFQLPRPQIYFAGAEESSSRTDRLEVLLLESLAVDPRHQIGSLRRNSSPCIRHAVLGRFLARFCRLLLACSSPVPSSLGSRLLLFHLPLLGFILLLLLFWLRLFPLFLRCPPYRLLTGLIILHLTFVILPLLWRRLRLACSAASQADVVDGWPILRASLHFLCSKAVAHV